MINWKSLCYGFRSEIWLTSDLLKAFLNNCCNSVEKQLIIYGNTTDKTLAKRAKDQMGRGAKGRQLFKKLEKSNPKTDSLSII